MRYEFDSEVLKGLPLNELMQEKAVLEEFYCHVRLLCEKKEEEMIGRVKKITDKRKLTKEGNYWISKKVGERRKTGLWE